MIKERSRTYCWLSDASLRLDNVTSVRVGKDGEHYIDHGDNDKIIVAPGWVWIDIDSDTWAQ